MQTSGLVAFAFSTLVSGQVALAQRGTGDWMTSAFDAQRSSWVRSDAKISKGSIQKPGFALVWKIAFSKGTRGLPAITPPALLDFYIGYRGFRSLAFFGLAEDRVIAVDAELGRIEWDRKYENGATNGASPCAGGMTSAVTRPTSTAYPPLPTGRGPGRGAPAKSGVGAPYEGAITIKAAEAAPSRPPSAKPAPAAPSPFAARVQYLLVLTGDGKLHSMYVSNAHEPKPAAQFVPPGANASGLIVFDDVAYVATAGGCGGTADGVWALDLSTNRVASWKSAGKIAAGTAGPAAGPDGTLYVAGGRGELAALSPRTLEHLASYKAPSAEFTSSPVVFDFKGRDLIAVSTNDGRLHLLAAADLKNASPLDRSAPYSTAAFGVRSLTSWQDLAGTRWVLSPAGGDAAPSAGFAAANGQVKNGAVVAWKVVEKGGRPAFEPGWVSRDLISPLPPVVVNGVVFALSSGSPSTPAVLYALDGLTGKELWNSGGVITSFVNGGGLAAGGSRVYVAARDGTQYAFGFPIEH
jgi:outer membrane protein assembly factor BamB